MNSDAEQCPLQMPGAISTIPGYELLRSRLQDQAIGARSVLADTESLLAVITSMCLLHRNSALDTALRKALDSGLEPEAISECVLQTGLYGGLPLVEESAEILAQVFSERGVSLPVETGSFEGEANLLALARRYQARLHGERHEAGHADPHNRHTSDLYRIATLYGYGMVWRRPGLSIRQRLIVALSSFASLGHVDQFFVKFVQTAIDHDLSAEEVCEVMVQISPFIGFPRALHALTLVDSAISRS